MMVIAIGSDIGLPPIQRLPPIQVRISSPLGPTGQSAIFAPGRTIPVWGGTFSASQTRISVRNPNFSCQRLRRKGWKGFTDPPELDIVVRSGHCQLRSTERGSGGFFFKRKVSGEFE
jgi:hypothetical protein